MPAASSLEIMGQRTRNSKSSGRVSLHLLLIPLPASSSLSLSSLFFSFLFLLLFLSPSPAPFSPSLFPHLFSCLYASNFSYFFCSSFSLTRIYRLLLIILLFIIHLFFLVPLPLFSHVRSFHIATLTSTFSSFTITLPSPFLPSSAIQR